MLLLPDVVQRLQGRAPRPRPGALRILDLLDPVEHLALHGGAPSLGPLEALEVLHADQRRLRTTPGCEDDALATVGRVVDQRGQPIAGLDQAHLLHGP